MLNAQELSLDAKQNELAPQVRGQKGVKSFKRIF